MISWRTCHEVALCHDRVPSTGIYRKLDALRLSSWDMRPVDVLLHCSSQTGWINGCGLQHGLWVLHEQMERNEVFLFSNVRVAINI